MQGVLRASEHHAEEEKKKKEKRKKEKDRTDLVSPDNDVE